MRFTPSGTEMKNIKKIFCESVIWMQEWPNEAFQAIADFHFQEEDIFDAKIGEISTQFYFSAKNLKSDL